MAVVDELVLRVTLDNQASGDIGGLISGLTGISGVAGLVTDALGAIADGIMKIGETAWDFAKEATGAFMSYEDQLALVGKTTGYAGDELKALGDDIRDLAKPIGSLKAEDLLKVAQVAGQLGVKGKDNIAIFSKEIGIGTIALDKFGGSTEKLGTHIAKSQVIFKGVTADTANYLSTLDALSKNTAANELEISNFNLQMGQFNASMKLSYQESSALGAVMVAGGMNASKAATQIGSAFTQLSTNSKAMEAATAMLGASADGGASAIARLEEITGRSRETFKSTGDMIQFALGEDAFNTMTLLAGEWGKIPNDTERISQGLDKASLGLDMFGAVGMKSMSQLSEAVLKQNDDLKSLGFALDTANKAYESGTSHLDSYNIQVDKTSEKTKILGSIWNDILLTFGEPMAKAFGELMDKIIPVADAFATWVKENERFQLVLNTVITKLKEIAGTVIDTLIEQFKKWFDYVSLNGDTLWQKITDGAQKLWKWLQDVGTAAQEMFVKLTDPNGGTSAFFSETLPNAVKAALTIIENIAPVIAKIGSAASKAAPLIELMGKAWNIVDAAIQFVRKNTEPFFNFIVNQIYAINDLLNGDLLTGLKNMADAFITLVSDMAGRIGEVFGTLKDLVSEVFSEMVSWISGKVSAAIDALLGKLQGVIGKLIGIDDTGVQKSTWPDMYTWVGKNIKGVDDLTATLDKVDKQLARMKFGIGVDTLSAQRQISMLTGLQTQLMAQQAFQTTTPAAPGLTTTGTIGTAAATPSVFGRSAGLSGATQPAASGDRVQSLTVNFNGQNIVDDRTKDAYVRETYQAMKELDKLYASID